VNAYSQVSPDAIILYLHEADQALYKKYIDEVDQMNVALHELFGHGTGKLLTRDPVTGALNYPPELINPLTGRKVENPYSNTESPNQRFGDIGSALEESKAEAVALYLNFFNETFSILCVKPHLNHYYSPWQRIRMG
jgi:dipeptidyl-peptidase III